MRFSFVPLVAALALAAPSAHAATSAGPTVAQCLAATEDPLALRNAHKLQASRAPLLVCSSARCPKSVQTECLRRIADLNATLPTIVFTVTRGSEELTAVKVSIDGEPPRDLDGTAFTLDPGSHEFTFQASGVPSITRRFILNEGEKNRHETVSLTPPTAPALVVAPVATEDPGHSRRVLGVVGMGTGVVGLVVGGVFGGLTISAWGDATSECPSRTSCSQQAVNHASTASSAGAVSTVALIAGGALVAAGAILYFTAPKSATTVGLEATPGWLGVTGRF